MIMSKQRGLISLESFDIAFVTPHRTTLDVTVPQSGDVTHEYKLIAHVIRPGDTFTITLDRKDTTPNAKAHIASYCSTVVGQRNHTGELKLKFVSITTNGTPNTNPPPGKYPEGTTEITFELHLEEKEMILIGIVLEVFRPGSHGTKQYLCDPQVGNGPP